MNTLKRNQFLTCWITSRARAPGTVTSSNVENILHVTWWKGCRSSTGASIKFQRSDSWEARAWIWESTLILISRDSIHNSNISQIQKVCIIKIKKLNAHIYLCKPLWFFFLKYSHHFRQLGYCFITDALGLNTNRVIKTWMNFSNSAHKIHAKYRTEIMHWTHRFKNLAEPSTLQWGKVLGSTIHVGSFLEVQKDTSRMVISYIKGILSVILKVLCPTFSFCRACSSERYSFNFLTEISSSLTWGVSKCSPRCRFPAISSRSIWIWSCTSANSFTLLSLFLQSISKDGDIAASCSLIVPDDLSGCKN